MIRFLAGYTSANKVAPSSRQARCTSQHPVLYIRIGSMALGVLLEAALFRVEGMAQPQTPGAVVYKLNEGEATKVSTAMAVMISMIILHFSVAIFDMINTNVLCICIRKWCLSRADSQAVTWGQTVNEQMARVTNQTPMLSVLILFCRLRALVDLEGTQPQRWAKNSMVFAAVLLYLETMLAAVVSVHTGVLLCKQTLVSLLKAIVLGNVITIIISIHELRKGPAE